MSYFLLYLILILDNISHSLYVILPMLTIAIFIFIIAFIATFNADEHDAEDVETKIHFFAKKILNIMVPFLIICIFLVTFLPTTKQAATIYLLPKIASNKNMQQLPSKTAELLLLEVKKEIASLNVNNISGITNAVTKKK